MSERISSSHSSLPSSTLHPAGALGTSSPSDSWRSSSSLSSLLPPPTRTDEILDDLAIPQFSLAIVAQKHGLTLSGMLTWLNLPETREVLALRESAAYAHARHVAALNIGHAVETVASIVRDYNTTRPEREAQDRKSPGFAHRAATNARKAAWLLLQFARIVPVNEADLRRASSHVTRVHRTANVSERMSGSPSQPVHPAGVLPDLPPASSLKDDADSTPSVSEGMPDTLKSSVSEQTSPDSDSRATGCLSASANNTTSTPSSAHRTANVSERVSSDSDGHATGCVVGGPTSAKHTTSTPSSAHRTANVSERVSSDSDGHATGCVVGGPTSANNTTSTPWRAHRTASVNERMSSAASSDSPLPSQPVHPAGALHDLPLASSLKDDANSPPAPALKADANSLDPPAPVPRPTHAA